MNKSKNDEASQFADFLQSDNHLVIEVFKKEEDGTNEASEQSKQ